MTGQEEFFDLDCAEHPTNPVVQALLLTEPTVGELLGRPETRGDKVVVVCDATWPALPQEAAVVVAGGYSFHVAIVDRWRAHTMARKSRIGREVVETLSRRAPPGLHHVVGYIRDHVLLTLARRTDSPAA